MAQKEKKQRRCFLIADELWEKMTIAARLDGRTVSSWMRSRVEMALVREIKRVIVPIKGA